MKIMRLFMKILSVFAILLGLFLVIIRLQLLIRCDTLVHAIIATNGRPHGFDKTLRRLQRKLGYADIRSMHDIRRTFATDLYYAGVGISQIRAWMGHSSEAQTYQYICFRDDPEDIKKLELIG